MKNLIILKQFLNAQKPKQFTIHTDISVLTTTVITEETVQNVSTIIKETETYCL